MFFGFAEKSLAKFFSCATSMDNFLPTKDSEY